MSEDTKLARALQIWLDQGGSLIDAIGREAAVVTRKEAELVCLVIDKARALLGDSEDWRAGNELHAAISLLQQVRSDEANAIARKHALPRLRNYVREVLEGAGSARSPDLFALKVLAMYGQQEDVTLLVEAVRKPLQPDSWMWTPVFYALRADSLNRRREALCVKHTLLCAQPTQTLIRVAVQPRVEVIFSACQIDQAVLHCSWQASVVCNWRPLRHERGEVLQRDHLAIFDRQRSRLLGMRGQHWQ